MSSLGYYALGAVSAILVAVFGFLGHRQKKIEDAQKSAKSEAVTELRHSEVKQGIGDVKREVGGVNDGIGAMKDALGELKKSITERTKSLRESLWEKYPFGYVLYGGNEGNFAAIPFHAPGVMQAEAKWENAAFQADYTKRMIRVEIPQPKWTLTNAPGAKPTGPHVEINIGKYIGTFPMVTNKPMLLRVLYVPNQPLTYFEILDDNQRHPIYVIGFKKPDAP